jgi:NitT/TauT family transport system substrate-binding protein
MRRLTRMVTVFAVTSLLASLSGCGGSDTPDADAGSTAAREKVTYLTSFGNFGRDAYIYVAKDKGYFADAGLDVEIKAGQGSADNIKTVVAGQAQYTPIDLTGGLLAMGNGQAADFVAVAAIQQRTMAAIISLEGNGIATAKDLEGKKLADTPGSVVRNLFPTYAKLAGVDPAKVTWVNGQAQTLIGTLAAGSVDGIGQFVVGQPTVLAVTKKNPVVLPYSEYLPDLFGNVLITSTRIASEKPEQVKKFTAALLRGLQHAIDNPKEAGEILAKNVQNTDPGAAAAELELMASYVKGGTTLGGIDQTRVARSITTLQEAGAIPAGTTPEKIVKFDLVPKA